MGLYIDTASRQPIYQQLAQQVREAIARGEMAAEARLPSVRQVARDLVVNPNTVVRAYAELESEGLLVSRQGLGIFVAPRGNELTKPARSRRLHDVVDRCLTEAVHLGFTAEELLAVVAERVRQFQWSASGSTGKAKG